MSVQAFLEWHLRGAIVLAVGGPLLEWLCSRWRIDGAGTRWRAVATLLVIAWFPWGWRVEVPWPGMARDGNDEEMARDGDLAWEVAARDPARMGEQRQGNDMTQAGLVAGAVGASSEWVGQRPAPPLEETRGDGAGLSWRWWLCGAWCLIVGGRLALMSVRYLSLVIHVNRMERRARRTDGRSARVALWREEWRQLQIETGIGFPLPLFLTARVGPLLGLLPRGFALLVPWRFWGSLEFRERQAVMRHELAHHERGDVLAAAVLRLLALPFAYHPSAWRLIRLFEEAAEWACDERAARDCGAVTYARTLQRLVEAEIPETTLAVGRCAQSHPLVFRVRRVLEPVAREELPMKRSLIAGALGVLALVSLVQVRLTAQEDREATIERVKRQVEELEGRLSKVKSAADELKGTRQKLEESVKERTRALEDLAQDPAAWKAETRQRMESLRGGDEARQLAALDGADKMGDEGLLLMAAALLDVDREAVRRRALAQACSLGNDGLPVLAKVMKSLSGQDRAFVSGELVKNKDKYDTIIFALLAGDELAEVRRPAIKVGLERSNPLAFVAVVADGNESSASELFEAAKSLSGEDLQTLLFAVAKKGPEKLLPETVDRAAALGEAGYPVISAIFHRKTPESRAAIVKTYRKSTKSIERLVVEEALRDADESLRMAAEAADKD